MSSFYHSGFCDWKHACACAEEHESSQPHRNAILTWLARTQAHGIDAELKEQCEEEQKYWQEVLKRVVAVKFLSERGLAFRGDAETIGSPNNGNYDTILICIAVLATVQLLRIRTASALPPHCCASSVKPALECVNFNIYYY